MILLKIFRVIINVYFFICGFAGKTQENGNLLQTLLQGLQIQVESDWQIGFSPSPLWSLKNAR